MDDHKSFVASFAHFVHQHFIWFIIGSYAIAALFPALGLWIRGVSFGEITLFHETTEVTLPMLLLAFLLCNAGFGVQTTQLGNLMRSPFTLVVGLSTNLLIPVAFIFGVTQGMRFWHNP